MVSVFIMKHIGCPVHSCEWEVRVSYNSTTHYTTRTLFLTFNASPLLSLASRTNSPFTQWLASLTYQNTCVLLV